MDALVGITPARAGNRCLEAAHRRFRRDHPRACGEQAKPDRLKNPLLGSPPRVRGTEHGGKCHGPVRGITPARAGNRGAVDAAANAAEDHPRACGEQQLTGPFRRLSAGSPPRVRGTVTAGQAAAADAGITPARAGNSLADRQRIEQV